VTPVVFDVPGAGKIGIAICYDVWFPEASRTLAAMGAEVILVPTMTNTIDRDVELSIARSTAAINQCIVVDVNVGGEQGFGRSVFLRARRRENP
jgi:predicted amidohydrolase